MATNREQHINNVTEDWLIENICSFALCFQLDWFKCFGKSNGYGKSGIPIFFTSEDHKKYEQFCDDEREKLRRWLNEEATKESIQKKTDFEKKINKLKIIGKC